MWKKAKVNSESSWGWGDQNDIESAPASPNVTSPSPPPSPSVEQQTPPVGGQIPSKWLSFENKKQYSLYYSFLLAQSSRTAIFAVVSVLTLAFGVYLLRLFTSKSVASVGHLLVLSRAIRFLFCAFGWIHLYFIRAEGSADDSSSKMTLHSADQLILWSSITGTMILLVRCSKGACGEDQNEDACNPRHEDHGLPTDTLMANLFLIVLLPVIFKAHRASILLLSYCVTFFGLIAASVVVQATADATLVVSCVIAFGMMIYDHERNMMTMFLVIQGQRTYYDRLLSLERIRTSAEIETVELRNLIGSIAHDLKTPLQAIMVELDGLQVSSQHTGGRASCR